VSGEIIEEKLIDTLMRTAIEHAGAERGLLILARGDEYRVEAEATMSSDTVTVDLRQASVTAADLPESVFHYVVRTKESVLLHDASSASPFSADEYIHRHHVRSILCLPFVKQARLVGVLYLENNLTSHVFTPSRTTVLKLLASEAAISLENTRLYGDLQEREARVRRLVDANIIGIFIWDLAGRIIDANEAFLRLVGYDRDDLVLVLGRLRWRELTPAEWRDADDRCVAELKVTGIAQPYEKEYFQKSGNRVPVLVGAANFEQGRDEGVAFVVDLTDRKRADEAVRESERRYREIEMELAHANRIATMGELAASIAHELRQPLSAAVTNGTTCQHWLLEDTLDLARARRAAQRMIAAAQRASEVMDRIRGLINKTPSEKISVVVNDLIRETLALIETELRARQIVVATDLAEPPISIVADRVQLQQVILNLIMNAVEAMSLVADRTRLLRISSQREPPSSVLVRVVDSGTGLDPTIAERIFDPFFTTKADGMGMGLSICRSIIDGHGGRLWASPAPSHGALVQFTLPTENSVP
jgi:PAS domain S-box-containing protein